MAKRKVKPSKPVEVETQDETIPPPVGGGR